MNQVNEYARSCYIYAFISKALLSVQRTTNGQQGEAWVLKQITREEPATLCIQHT